MIRADRIEQVSKEFLSSLSNEVILALAALSSRLRSSLSIASLETGTEFFFCFLGGGCEAGAKLEAVTVLDAGVEDTICGGGGGRHGGAARDVE